MPFDPAAPFLAAIRGTVGRDDTTVWWPSVAIPAPEPGDIGIRLEHPLLVRGSLAAIASLAAWETSTFPDDDGLLDDRAKMERLRDVALELEGLSRGLALALERRLATERERPTNTPQSTKGTHPK